MTKVIETLTLETILEGVDGWLFPDEAKFLMRLASEVQPPNVIVEIGSYRGRSTLALTKGLMQGAKEKVKLFSIDSRESWEGEPDHFSNQDRVVFERNLGFYGVQDLVYPVSLPSYQVGIGWDFIRNPVGLIFIDGNHTTQAVRWDVTAWTGNLVEGAKIAFHDENNSTVRDAIESFTNLALVEKVDITAVYELRRG